MVLQKKQVYLNKVLSKHYKKLGETLLNDTNVYIQGLKTPKNPVNIRQSIGISVLTIDTTSNNVFPGIVDVTVLNVLRKTQKAVILYKGKTTVSTQLTRSISKLASKMGHSKNKKLKKKVNNCVFLNDQRTLKAKSPLGTLQVINKMLGTGICMHNYQLCFNSHLSLQNWNFLKCKEKETLQNLDRLAASLIVPQSALETTKKSLKIQNQGTFKMKEVRFSKMELSSVIAQVLYKIHFFKNSFDESLFNMKKLSNILGAFVEINSKIYFVSDKELKQCGVVGGLKYCKFYSNTVPQKWSPLLGNLVYSKMPAEKTFLLETKSIEPNRTFFNFLNITTRIYTIHNVKRILSKLINILTLLALESHSRSKKVTVN